MAVLSCNLPVMSERECETVTEKDRERRGKDVRQEKGAKKEKKEKKRGTFGNRVRNSCRSADCFSQRTRCDIYR